MPLRWTKENALATDETRIDTDKNWSMHVLVIEAPELHLGFLGCYGNEWLDTPHLSRLAAEGVVFDQHFAECPYATVRSAWSGRCLGSQNEMNDLIVHLNRAGIACQQVRGAEAWESALSQMAERASGLVWLESAPLGPPWQAEPELALQLLEMILDNSDHEFPLFDPPSRLPDDHRLLARIHAAYGATVSALDANIGMLLSELEERGLLDQMLLFVTAHQGLALGEHGLVGKHSSLPYEEIAHLPLLARLPGGQQAGHRVSTLTQPVDLFPTVLQAFDLPPEENLHGHSLWPLLLGGKGTLREYAITASEHGEPTYSLRTPEWTVLHSAERTELYRRPEDRWEVNNVAQHYQVWVEALVRVLKEFIDAARKPGPLVVPKLPSWEEIQS